MTQSNIYPLPPPPSLSRQFLLKATYNTKSEHLNVYKFQSQKYFHYQNHNRGNEDTNQRIQSHFTMQNWLDSILTHILKTSYFQSWTMKNKQNYNPVCSMLNCPPQGYCILQNIKVTHNSRKLSIKRLAIDPEEWNYLQKHRKYCREMLMAHNSFTKINLCRYFIHCNTSRIWCFDLPILKVEEHIYHVEINGC